MSFAFRDAIDSELALKSNLVDAAKPNRVNLARSRPLPVHEAKADPALKHEAKYEPSLKHDARTALIGLGFKPTVACEAVELAITHVGNDITIERLLFNALRLCPRPATR